MQRNISLSPPNTLPTTYTARKCKMQPISVLVAKWTNAGRKFSEVTSCNASIELIGLHDASYNSDYNHNTNMHIYMGKRIKKYIIIHILTQLQGQHSKTSTTNDI